MTENIKLGCINLGYKIVALIAGIKK